MPLIWNQQINCFFLKIFKRDVVLRSAPHSSEGKAAARPRLGLWWWAWGQEGESIGIAELVTLSYSHDTVFNIFNIHIHSIINQSINLFVCLSIYLSVCLSVYLSVCLSVYLPVCLSVYLSVCLSIYLSVCLSVCLSIYLSIYLSVCLSVYLPVCLSVYLPVCLSVYLSVCLSVYLPVCLSVYLSVCLSIYLSVYLPVCLSVCLSVYTKSLCKNICIQYIHTHVWYGLRKQQVYTKASSASEQESVSLRGKTTVTDRSLDAPYQEMDRKGSRVKRCRCR